ncbi:ribosome biogenesis protein [Thermofilum pendens]|uniref:Ribosomal RNA small subunit methyltransferase Nep1 n=1 Tax=Thermofilum pendens (strain DSM 2475 / Hrk 5) TaxID=368408 RepID=A1RXN3_THEPD|nr:ribosome biogenesis protein [Thermofilum pendens]ABL77963.1 Suppressor Mra1 [Thermofilum pendens Hrk 5]
MKKLVLVLADAGLELVPRELWSHPAVKSHAKRRGKNPGRMLLDISVHYAAMKTLNEYWKRGRPDIVHVSLLVAQDSVLNRLGYLHTVIHTYDGKLVELDPSMVVPRNYNRFVGLFEQLLEKGQVPPGSEKPLAKLRTGRNLGEVLKEMGVDAVYRLSEKGEPVKPLDLARRIAGSDVPAVIIGAFQRGEFSKEVLSIEAEEYSIFREALPAWTVVAEVVVSLEHVSVWGASH